MMNSATVQISMELWGAIICLMFASFIFIGEDKNSRRGYCLIAMLLEIFAILLSDSIAWAYRGEPGKVAYYAVRISNYLVFILNYVIGFTSMLYLNELLAVKNTRIAPLIQWTANGICIAGFTVVTVSQFTGFLYTFDEQNRYHRADGYWLIGLIATAMVVLMSCIIIYYIHKEKLRQAISLLMIFLLELVATPIQILLYGISLANLAMAVGVVMMFFSYEKERIAISSERKTMLLEKDLRFAQQEAEMARKDAEMATINAQLVEKRTQIMLSQIQPHFLYNALSAVSFLCIKDPMKAKETIDNFAFYLRTNLNSLRNDHLVPFEQELQHTKAYLAIEQTRFGEDLAIEYDIQCTDFVLPSLSVQPMAENAVRHGICGREDGGTVTIRTERKDGNIVITVIDDGIGFDPSVKPQDGRIHVGMENVTQRVRTLCGGDLIVESAPGKGTTATIILPDQGQE